MCGADRGTLEEYDIDKEEHEGSEHNKWSYLLYLDHVKQRRRTSLRSRGRRACRGLCCCEVRGVAPGRDFI